ncbi:MAG: DUF2076 domain-containing protein [Halothiobacillus sp.]|nr:DUF2076 domain-containing protein [Halothiobacillus sp.]
MNAQEHTLLTDLLNKLKEAAPGAAAAKDPEADRLIRDTLAATPDAAYLLVQRHLLLEMALERAQAELKAIQAKASGSFLGGATGYGADSRPAQTNAYGQPIGRAEPATVAAPTTASQATTSATTSATRPAFGGGSFLGTAAATATGVLGGALLFQGIEHLMGGGLGGSALAGNQPVEDVTNITENVYESPADMSADTASGGWDNASMTDNGSAFDDPMADPIDPMQSDNSGLFDQDDAGGGFFDGWFGGGDDDWV